MLDSDEAGCINNTSDMGRGILAFGRRISVNMLWLLLGRVIAQGLMVLFTLIVARRLGETGLGIYAFMVAVVFLGNVITTFGTDMLIVRESAAHNNLALLVPAGLIQLTFSSVFVGLVFTGVSALPNIERQAIQAVRLYSLALFPMVFYTIFSAALRSYERMKAYMWLTLFLVGIQVILAWFFLDPGSGAVKLAWLLILSQAAAAIVAFLLCINKLADLSHSWKINLDAIPILLRKSAPIALLGVLKVTYQRMSIYLLSTLLGAGITGYFSAAMRTVEASQLGHVALLGALFPVMAQAHQERYNEKRAWYWNKMFTLSGRVLLAFGVLLAAILYVLAPQVVRLLYGPEFEASISALRLLTWIMVPYSINIFISSRFLAERRESEITTALLLSLLALIGLNIWLIPRLGLIGACTAALGAEAVQAGLYLYYSYAHQPGRPPKETET